MLFSVHIEALLSHINEFVMLSWTAKQKEKVINQWNNAAVDGNIVTDAVSSLNTHTHSPFSMFDLGPKEFLLFFQTIFINFLSSL